MKQGNTIKIIKKANSYLVLSIIQKFEAVTVDDLVRKSQLSRPTILNILSELMNKRIISKSGYRESASGRQPVLYTLNLKSYYAIGIDFEFPPMRVVFTDINGNSVFSKLWDQKYDDPVTSVVDAIKAAIYEGMAALNIDLNSIVGAGLGIPGIVNTNKNVPISIPRIPAFKGIDINALTKEMGIPFYIKNDAHLLALADYAAVQSKSDIKNILYIAYRTGIGMAIFENGKLYEGENGNSGYIGHTTFKPNGDLCTCGKRGCLELYCSKQAIIKNYLSKKHLDNNDVTFERIMKEADSKDEYARKILKEAGECFAISISNALNLFDVSTVIIGDLPFGNNSYFISLVRKIINENTKYKGEKIGVFCGSIDPCSYALGGCMLALEHFFEAPNLKLSME